jgi:hypothetical protein
MSTIRGTKVFSVYKDINDKVVEKTKLAALSVCAKIIINANEKVVTAIQTVIEDLKLKQNYFREM